MRTPTLLSTCAALLALGGAGAHAQQPPRPGQPMQRPDAAPRNTRSYGLFAERPVAGITAANELTIEFETAEPTPPATVYVGLSTLDEELDFPRYRQAVREGGRWTEPRTEHRVVVDFGRLRRRMPNTAYAPRIEWRLEVWSPAARSARFWEGRNHFDPETGGDAPTITYGPFVDQVDRDAATISWQTDRPTDAEVRISGRVFGRAEPATEHVIRVDGLLPAVTYAYVVRSGTTTMRPYAFRTAGGGRVRFAAMVDSREGVGGGLRNFHGVEALALRALTSHAYRQDLDFVLFAGDLINGYTSSVADFRMQLDAWRRATMAVQARVPFYEGMGNHESLVDNWPVPGDRYPLSLDKQGDDSAEAVFADTVVNPTNGPANEGPGTPPYRENVYWFDRGPVRVFVLNNNYWWSSDPHGHGGNLEGYVLERQLAWLREQVAGADADDAVRHLFFAAQEPPFPNGGHTRDAMWWSGGDTDRDGDVDGDDFPIVACRNTLWSIVSSSAKTVAFITGDEHAYSRLWVGPDTPVGPRTALDGGEAEFGHGVWQITAGGAGAPWYDKELDLPWSGGLRAHSTLPHYALFDVGDGDVELRVHSETGQVVDRATLRRADRNRP